MSGVFEVQHPLIACHLTRLRDKTTPPAEFRQLVHRLASLLAYEASVMVHGEASDITVTDLYGDGQAGGRIAELLATVPLTIDKRLAY